MANLELCRLCLNYAPVHYSLLKSEYNGMLSDLTAIWVTGSDETLTEVCVKCLLNLKLAHRIQQRFLKADERLRVEPALRQIRPVTHELVEVKVENTEDSLDDLINEPPEDSLENRQIKEEELSAEESASFKCRFCDLEFKSRFELREHKHETAPCPVCKKELKTSGMSHHIKHQHKTPNRLEVCDLCGGTFLNLTKHKLRVHNDNRPLLECEECGKMFKRQSSLMYHRKRDHIGGLRELVCEACGKIFYSKTALQKHTESKHSEVKRHPCSICNKEFAQRFALKSHLRQHTNETPFSCEICGEAFRHNVSLRTHRKSKHGLKEQEVVHCKVCRKGFASSSGLKVHEMKLHM